jgi:hypothetical protein
MTKPSERSRQPSLCRQVFAPKFHSRLKHGGGTVDVLQGNTQAEARTRAARLADALSPSRDDVSIIDA